MKILLGKFGALALIAPSLVMIAATSAQAADCAVGVRTYTDGASKYAVVKNVCNKRIDAKVIVPNFPDTGCQSIAANGTKTFRTGGILSPTATGAKEC